MSLITVQDLLNRLQQVKDKEMPVVLLDGSTNTRMNVDVNTVWVTQDPNGESVCEIEFVWI